ncbi:hypothetical protein EVAR_102399_1 [Eumeta japonica]|uniref:Uncharacterized protein n=1 Tax=Eumeta variegata TaxID=151549 RepID=A0A4C1YNF2_EUMVA|nr:hypothetical protein EVAR_102399_1 [Eumeta japonica]
MAKTYFDFKSGLINFHDPLALVLRFSIRGSAARTTDRARRRTKSRRSTKYGGDNSVRASVTAPPRAQPRGVTRYLPSGAAEPGDGGARASSISAGRPPPRTLPSISTRAHQIRDRPEEISAADSETAQWGPSPYSDRNAGLRERGDRVAAEARILYAEARRLRARRANCL